jgi:predicted peptidase
MILRKKFAKWTLVALFLVSLGVLSNPARGQTNQITSQQIHAPTVRRDATPLSRETGNGPLVSTQASSMAASNLYGYDMHTYTENPGGMKMTYYLHVPTDYDPEQSYPLVLLLHGGGESANPNATPEQNSTLILSNYYVQQWISSTVQERWSAFILIPQVVAPARWVNVPASTGSYTMSAQPSDSLRMAKEITDMVQLKYQGIDPHRLYVTGLSMGGYGTWEAIERWPDYFAAAAPLSGAGDPSKAASLAHLPIWAFHGAQDTVVPVSGSRDMIQAILRAGGHARYTEYPNDGHDLWGPNKVYTPATNPAFFVWLFAQKQPA